MTMTKIFAYVFAKIKNKKTERPFHALYTIAADPMLLSSLITASNLIIQSDDNSNEKEHVIIQPDDKIYNIIHQMITPNHQMKRSMFSSSQMITSMVSSCQMVHIILYQPNHKSDQKGEGYHPSG
jgi:hypothetical protein